MKYTLLAAVAAIGLMTSAAQAVPTISMAVSETSALPPSVIVQDAVAGGIVQGTFSTANFSGTITAIGSPILPSGSRASLPKPSPLRTGRDDCSSSGSSLSRAVRGTEGAAPATTCASIPGHARWSVRCQASSNFANGCCRSVASLPPRPVGSLHPFGLGISHSRRPYLPHYRTAFAFSDSPLPPPSSPFLAVGIPPCSGTNGAYPVVQCGDADGEAAPYSPAGRIATVVSADT